MRVIPQLTRVVYSNRDEQTKHELPKFQRCQQVRQSEAKLMTFFLKSNVFFMKPINYQRLEILSAFLLQQTHPNFCEGVK